MSYVSLMAGDAETRLREMPYGIVHACVTSPGYYGLRDYGNDAQIGHEATPKLYVERLVAAFRGVRRVLRDDGSCWIVIGDSYARDSKVSWDNTMHREAGWKSGQAQRNKPNATDNGYKPKDLIGIPWMLAFALRDDGWYLREAIVWKKDSCMPESVRDRCTMQHEYVFHMTKSERYFHDWFAIAEPAAGMNEHDLTGCGYEAPGQSPRSGSRSKRVAMRAVEACGGTISGGTNNSTIGLPANGLRNARSVWTINPEPFDAQSCGACGTYHRGADYKRLTKDGEGRRTCGCGASDRWLSHFAVFPSRLASRMIRASTPDGGCCPSCDSPLERIVEKGEPDEAWRRSAGADSSGSYAGSSRDGFAESGAQDASAAKARILAGMTTKRTAGWRRTCGCPDDGRPPVPATVLDLFSGAGTTMLCAARLGRQGIGIDLNEGYLAMSMRRLADPKAKCLDTDGARLEPVETTVGFA